MGRFAEKYSRQQKDALYEACLDRPPATRLTPRQAVKAANDGSLMDGLAPFDMPLNTAAAYVRDERAKRRGRDIHPTVRTNPRQALRRAVELQLSAVIKESEQLLEQAHRNPAKLDLQRLDKLASTDHKLIKLLDTLEQVPAPKQNGGGPAPKPDGLERQARGDNGFTAGLAAEHKRAAAPTQHQTPPAPTSTTALAETSNAGPATATHRGDAPRSSVPGQRDRPVSPGSVPAAIAALE